MKIEIPLKGRPDRNLALIFEDIKGKELDMGLTLIQRGSPSHVEIGVVSKSDLKRLAKAS